MCEVADFRQMLDGRRVRLRFYMYYRLVRSYLCTSFRVWCTIIHATVATRRHGITPVDMLLLPALLPYLPVRTLHLSPVHFIVGTVLESTMILAHSSRWYVPYWQILRLDSKVLLILLHYSSLSQSSAERLNV